MADPGTWAIVASVASTAIGAVGAIQSAQAQSGAADYNAQIAQQNASVMEAQGQAAADAQHREAQRRQGSAVAAYGASGVQTDTGSPADVLSDSVRQATLDNLTTQYNYKLRGLGYSDQAALDESNARNSSTAGYFNAAGQLIGGGSRALYYSKSGGSGGTGYGGGVGVGYGGYGSVPNFSS